MKLEKLRRRVGELAIIVHAGWVPSTTKPANGHG